MDHYEDIVYEPVVEKPQHKKNNWEDLIKPHIKRVLISLLAILISRVTFYQLSPMVVAFYSVIYLDKASRIWIFLSSLLGLSLALPIFDFFKYVLIITSVITLGTYLEKRGKKLTLTKNAVISSVCTVLINLAYVFLQQNQHFHISLSLLEGVAVLALTFIYSKGIFTLFNKEKKMPLNNEAFISFGVLGISVIIGAAHLELFSISFMEPVLYVTILYFGYVFGSGMGAVVGLIAGFILALMGIFTPIMAGVFGLLGILSGVFKEIGKIGSTLGFVMGGLLLGYYYAPELLEPLMLRALFSSGFLFLLIPKQWIYRVPSQEKKMVVDHHYYKEKIQKLTKDRLKHFAASFEKLSDTFRTISDKRSGLSQQEVNQLFDEVAEKVCASCSMCTLCWQKEFYDTYKAAFSILGAAEKKGKIQKEDVPKEFVHKCIKLEEFVSTTNRLFDLFKINLAWHNRIVESRELVSEQLISVAHIIDNFSKDLYQHIELEKELEYTLEEELKKLPIKIENILVMEKQNRIKEVYLTVSTVSPINSKELVPLISKVLGKKMKLEEGSKYIVDKEPVELKFVEEKLFKTIHGIARATKDGEAISGDNFSFLDLPSGQMVLALSDGMGTGVKAFKESEAAIDLLEQFMEAGFDKQTAIKLINSVLVLKSTEHSFSTVDMSIIDRYTGICEFVKIGAAATFIKRSDSVECIKSTSMPVGVMNQVDYETTTRKLYEGDFIIMVTDGIVDADKGKIEKEEWIEEALGHIHTKNPQEIADYLLEKAKEKAGYVADDMTVLVSRLWKK